MRQTTAQILPTGPRLQTRSAFRLRRLSVRLSALRAGADGFYECKRKTAARVVVALTWRRALRASLQCLLPGVHNP